ncbi:hypothetical protein C0J52_01308 [Blattella germanica]|nr:hypothetical protein C0J52_01308 [Blattella germanica]
MSLDPPTSEQLQAIRDEYGFDQETIKKNALEIQQWLDEQPHLPSGNTAGLQSLELLFLRCKGNHDKMKESLEVYYGMKNIDPDTLLNRDPDTEWFRDVKELIKFVPLPTLTPDNCRVMLGSLVDPTLTKHNPHHILKIANMVLDVRNNSEFCPNDIYILDVKNVTLGHVLRYPISLIHEWIKEIESRREWFLEQDKCKTDESKRLKKKKKR